MKCGIVVDNNKEILTMLYAIECQIKPYNQTAKNH